MPIPFIFHLCGLVPGVLLWDLGFERCKAQSQAPHCTFAVSERINSALCVMSLHFTTQLLPGKNGCSFREPHPPHRLRAGRRQARLGSEGLCEGGDLPLGEPHGRGESRVMHSLDRDTLSRPGTTRFATYGSVYGPCQ